MFMRGIFLRPVSAGFVVTTVAWGRSITSQVPSPDSRQFGNKNLLISI